MEVHIPTIFMVIIAAGTTLALAIAVVAWGRDRNLLLWSGALALHTCAFGLFRLRGQIPDVASVVLGNVLLSSTFAMFAEGLYRFQQKPCPRWLVWTPVVIVGVGFYVLIFDQTVRIVLGGVVFTAQAVILLGALAKRHPTTTGRGQYILALGASLVVFALVLRTIATAAGQVETLRLTTTSASQTAMFLMSIVCLMLLAIGLVIMTMERAERESHQSEQLERVRSHTLELLAKDAPLAQILENLVRELEVFIPAAQCNIVLLDASDKDLADRAGLGACWSQPIRDAAGAVLGTFAIFHRVPTTPAPADIHLIEQFAGLASIAIERGKAAQIIRASVAHYRLLTEGVSDVVWKMDANSRFTYMSPADERMRGFRADEVVGHHVFELFPPDAVIAIKQQLSARDVAEQSGARQDSMTFEVQQHCKDGSLVWTEIISNRERDIHDNIVGHHGITRNITERKQAQEQVHQLAFYDALTRLANRRLLNDRLIQALARSKRDESRLGLLFIDLDKFKPVNDIHGHAMGDWLLQTVAQRIENCLRASDTAARVGGDEFVVLLPSMQSAQDALAVAEKIRHSLELPLITDSQLTLSAAASIGVAVCPDHGGTVEDLLRIGDAAMYRAKKAGGNRVEISNLGDQPDALDASEQMGGSIVQLTWKKAFCSGHETIDRDHRELFRLANILLEKAATVGIEPAHFNAAFDALLTHVVKHFAAEESILAEINYPYIEQHAQKHRALVAQALALRSQSDLGQVSLGEIVAFLANDVVARHVLQEDRKFFFMYSDLTHLAAPGLAEAEHRAHT